MRRHEIIDALCFDGEGSPYPLELLYQVEGLAYPELMKVLRAFRKDGTAPPLEALAARGERRRKLVEALGAEPESSGELAASAASAIDTLGVALKRAGLELPARGRAELLQVAAQLLGAMLVNAPAATASVFPDAASRAIAAADALIEAVDVRTRRHTRKAEPAEWKD